MGFRVDLDFGKTADLVAAFEPEDDGSEIYKHIQQAYVSLLTGKVQWDVGKFVTPIGAEVIESQDNWNYTRSILFGYAIPFYHVGVRATLAASDKVTLTGFLLNGWNNSSELNGDKTFAVERDPEAEPEVHLVSATTWAARRWRAATPADLFDTTASLALGEKFTRHGQLRLRQGRRREVVGRRRLREAPGRRRTGRSWAATSTSTTREGGFMLLGHQGPEPDRDQRPPDRGRASGAARVPDRLRRRRTSSPRTTGLQGLADDPDRRAGRTASAGRSDQPGARGRAPLPIQALPEGGGMTPSDVLKLAKEKGAKIVDLRFIDMPGLWQHFSIPVAELTEELFSEGIGFDGSSIRGFQAINESDMLLFPDARHGADGSVHRGADARADLRREGPDHGGQLRP